MLSNAYRYNIFYYCSSMCFIYCPLGNDPFSFCDSYHADTPNEECGVYCSKFGKEYFNTYGMADFASTQYDVVSVALKNLNI